MLPSNKYGQHGRQSALPTGCTLDDVTVVTVVWTCCALGGVQMSFCCFTVTIKVSRVSIRVRFRVSVRIGVRVGLYWNRWGEWVWVPILYTEL